ncbi:TIGR02757 family protein [Carboxylicivirga mesophila]|uniref:TIGR02757 family protein n=1 Tax=Carboxylicivirga mesophila TaxID=1166478 RepID=A0ABS5KEN8_9BACT|nr:TIGR02757 family protein [Carboxylicivirga mesophila]MBS2213524.1 TIGR02757 family protein [Carboxylicivirga mesophila]
MELIEIKDFLDEKVNKYNRPEFIEDDPISIPRLYTKKEDIEIAAFLTAAIAWGRRDLILKSAKQLMSLLENAPCDFLLNASENEWSRFEAFYYRTFSSVDCLYFVKALKAIYLRQGGLEQLFTTRYQSGDIKPALVHFRSVFLSFEAPDRTSKHIANIEKGSSAKRLNMFLRWMVRKDNRGVDFGIWQSISSADLLLPLDVHTGNVSRQLGILKRKQNDIKAVDEIMLTLREFDAADPVKYDFALFSLGVNESF